MKPTALTKLAPESAPAVVLKHFTEERCTCTADLREQYPASLLPRTLWVGGLV